MRNIVHSSSLSSSPPQLHINTDTTAAAATATAIITTTTTGNAYGATNQKSPRTNGTEEKLGTAAVTPQILGGNTSRSNVAEEEETSTPASAEAVADRISRIDSDVFNRISGINLHKTNSISRKPVGSGVGRMNSVMSRRSVYSVGSDSVSNYSSAVQSPVEGGGEGFKRNDSFDSLPKRSGVKKFVGQPTEDMLEVVIGETKYAVTKVRGVQDDRPVSGDWSSSSPVMPKPNSRPGTGGGELKQEAESTVVFLGHGRGMSVGGVDVDFGPTANLGGKLGPKEKNVVKKKAVQDRNLSRDSDAGVGKRRSVAWAPGMVNFNANALGNENNNAGEVAPSSSSSTTGNTHKGKEEEFDAESYVGAQFELAQQSTDVMRNKLLNQHHQRSGSLGTGQFLSYFGVGRRKSPSPSNEKDQAGSSNGSPGGAARPVHSRTNSVSGDQLRRISRAGSAGDLLSGAGGGSSGSNSPSLTSRPQSRSANKELASGGTSSRPQSQGNLLSRPASRGPSQLLSSNNPSTAALPLHALPPPMVSPMPPSSYHPPQVAPTASIYHPPPHLQSGPPTPSVTDHYSHHHQRKPSNQAGNPGNGKLSAGEQEYIARTTGTPLLGQNWNSETSKIKKAPPHKAGLLGQMEQREKEKKDFKERTNRNSWTVQQAMRQRQSMVGMESLMQQQAQLQAQQQAQLQAHQQQQQIQQQQQQQQMGMGYGYGGQQMGQPMQQHYGFYGHQQPQQQPQNAAALAAWNAQQQQQQMMIMQQQQQMIIQAQQQQQWQQQTADRRGSWRYG
ncbi:hypothetical protein TWF281_004131 [Arthrobotrys megalospora]